MAFCKVCACGNKIVFERRLSFPDNCPFCGRKLVDFLTYNEDDPHVEELLNVNMVEKPIEKDVFQGSDPIKEKYILKLDNGKEIEIPDDGGIVGRTGIGAEELAEYPSVSRQHLRITPRRNIGVLVEDLSAYGTLVDGHRIEKNTQVRVANGSSITLCDVNALLTIKEVNNE